MNKYQVMASLDPEKAIVCLLHDFGDVINIQDILTTINLNRKTAKKYLDRLVDKGMIHGEVVGRAKVYSLVSR